MTRKRRKCHGKCRVPGFVAAAIGVAALLAMPVVPAGASVSDTAEAVAAAREEVRAIVREIRTDWRGDAKVVKAFADVEQARRGLELERRQIVKLLEATDDDYVELQQKAAIMQARLEEMHREHQAEPETIDPALVDSTVVTAADANRSIDGSISATLRTSGKTVAAGEMQTFTRRQLEQMLEEEEPLFKPIGADMIEQAQQIMLLRAQIDALEDAAIDADANAAKAKQKYYDAVGVLDKQQEALKTLIVSDPKFDQALQKLDRAQARLDNERQARQ